MKMLLANLRTGLLIRYAPANRDEVLERISDTDKAFFKDVLQERKGVFTSKTLSILLDAYLKIDASFIKTLPLELAIVDILGNNSEV
jgi:hypothetical protein